MGSTTKTPPAEAPTVAIVTGGNRGLGLETCRQLAGLGMQVVLASRNLAHGEAAAELRGRAPGRRTAARRH
jgi:(+)-neomenthol dehydrogenase